VFQMLRHRGSVVGFAIGRTLLVMSILASGTQVMGQVVETIITGRVLGTKNLPVSNAQVGLQSWGFNEQHKQHDDDFVATAKTDFEGRFQLAVPPNLDLKNKLGTVWALAKGYVPNRPSSYGTVSGLVGDHVTIRLTSADETAIRVIESSGTPAKDVHVHVSAVRLPNTVGWPMPRRWTDQVQATTNEQGDARLPHSLPEAINGIILSRPGMSDVWLDANFFLNMRPVEEEPAFTFQLPPTGTIAGQLIVTDGVLPQPLTMRIQTQSRLPNQQRLTAWGQADVPVNADGKFHVTGIATGRILILPFLPEDQVLRATVPPNVSVSLNDVTNLEIPVAPGTLVRGQIRKGDTKEGAAQFQLAVIYGQSARDHSSMYEKFELETDTSGKFSTRVPAGRIELRLHSVPPGYQSVEWWSPTTRGVWGTKREIPIGKAEFDLDPIDLDPSKALKGRLIDAGGEPLVGWSVYGFPDLPNKPRTESRMNCFGGVDTNDKGEFEGSYPLSFPPAYWNVRDGNPKASRNFTDSKQDATIVTTTPLVIQVNSPKPTGGTP
jgi:hypothetical protein